MTPMIIKNVKSRDIPPRWLGNARGYEEQTFTLIITPERKPGSKAGINKSVSERNRIFDMLEGVSDSESSEEWIALVKAAHKNASLKAEIE